MGRRPGGFTLIELLVVVTIGTVLAGIAVLSLGRWGSADEPREQLARLAGLLELQCEQALFQARSRGIRVLDSGFDFWQAGSAGWAPLPGEGVSRPRAWTAGAEAVLFIEGRRQPLTDTDDVPQIVCQPLGELTPFELELRVADRAARLAVSAGGRIDLPAR